MGCWGIMALQSDSGLDAVSFIRDNLPEDGSLSLDQVIELLQSDDWNAPAEVTDGESHPSPMAVAEIVMKFLDGEAGSLDRGDEEKKFSSVATFTASKDSLQWLKQYLFETLRYSREHAAAKEGTNRRWNGWFQKEDWMHWQAHMEGLIGRLEELLETPGERLELIAWTGQESKTQEELADKGISMQMG